MGRRPKWIRLCGTPIVIVAFFLIGFFIFSFFDWSGNLWGLFSFVIAGFACKIIGWVIFGYSDWFSMKNIDFEIRDSGGIESKKDAMQKKIDKIINDHVARK